jgi:hypothetical protein
VKDHPQRLVIPFAPGSRLKGLREKSDRLRKRFRPAEQQDPNYLKMIRAMPCVKCGMEPCGVSAHVRIASAAFAKASGMGRKPSDRFAIPLCAACHTGDRDSQHKLGERAFWWLLGINPLLLAEKLYAQRGDLVAMRAVVMYFIGHRKVPLQRERQS